MAQGHDSQQQPDEHALPYKKVKLDHLVKQATSKPSVEREIQQFKCLNISTGDGFTWR